MRSQQITVFRGQRCEEVIGRVGEVGHGVLPMAISQAGAQERLSATDARMIVAGDGRPCTPSLLTFQSPYKARRTELTKLPAGSNARGSAKRLSIVSMSEE